MVSERVVGQELSASHGLPDPAPIASFSKLISPQSQWGTAGVTLQVRTSPDTDQAPQVESISTMQLDTTNTTTNTYFQYCSPKW